MSVDKRDLSERAERLGDLLLKRYEVLLGAGELSSADAKVLYQILKDNGWSFDPASIPQELQSKLLTSYDPSKYEDEDVLPFPRTA